MIVVTGATGPFGHAVVQHLLERGVPAGEIVAAARAPERAGALASQGVGVREADYDRPETLAAAFAGADRLMFVSANGPNEVRIAQHRSVVDAAKRAGVGLVVYTSLVDAPDSPLILAPVHRDTEQALVDSGLPTVLLRNGWYTENFTGNLQYAVDQGVIVGAADEDARIASASRADLAEAAAAVLTSDVRGGEVYELTGDDAWTPKELASTADEIMEHKPVVYRQLSPEEYAQVLAGAGVPPFMVDIIVDADLRMSEGVFSRTSGDLRRLLGRPTRTLRDSVWDALQIGSS
ncbi:SDR family oxidoreductase [Tessaracoccus oleiagri]|uniref:NAD(P)H dehydrogenase (Quinone) n=1 Tax=Tessaracoccus oleiagri TaxID=686624 RepID=A0A1G9HE76_9ACTN|nr:SDR family oxidoreductase [Tessaracoccus oleiagri]SDL11280.1 NAD(P)H dehydrogenase (quinone) [Tessaracoccus oleiagri]